MRVVVKPKGFAFLAAAVLAGAAIPRLIHRPALSGLLREQDWTYTAGDGIKAHYGPLKEWGIARGWKFVAEQKGQYGWSQSWTNTLNASPLPAGETFTLRFRARSRTGSPFAVRLQENRAPYLSSMDKTIAPGPAWGDYEMTGRSRGYEPGGSQITFQLSQDAGEIDLADIRFEKVDEPAP